MTGLIASVVEAYGELRVNKGRIMLALIGVAFSVFALTAVLGAGSLLRASFIQLGEAQNGRDAVVETQAYSPDGGTELSDRIVEEYERLHVTHWTRRVEATTRVQMSTGVQTLAMMAVDPAYSEMYRVKLLHGRWLTAADRDRLAPALVVNEAMYEKNGAPPLGAGIPITLHGPEDGTDSGRAVIVGVVKDVTGVFTPAGMNEAMMLADSTGRLPGAGEPPQHATVAAWVPPAEADALTRHMLAAIDPGPGGEVSVTSNTGMSATADVVQYLSWGLAGIAGIILILGAMGLVNISLVSMRYRIREIGIRRSYGATGSRIFVGVMMESVVATVIAGAVGVTLAVAALRLPIVTEQFEKAGLVETPAFPMSAVLVGMAAATVVGMLAGALPAIVATRIKVIDAIRS